MHRDTIPENFKTYVPFNQFPILLWHGYIVESFEHPLPN